MINEAGNNLFAQGIYEAQKSYSPIDPQRGKHFAGKKDPQIDWGLTWRCQPIN
jgi:hypothetical protein